MLCYLTFFFSQCESTESSVLGKKIYHITKIVKYVPFLRDLDSKRLTWNSRNPWNQSYIEGTEPSVLFLVLSFCPPVVEQLIWWQWLKRPQRKRKCEDSSIKPNWWWRWTVRIRPPHPLLLLLPPPKRKNQSHQRRLRSSWRSYLYPENPPSMLTVMALTIKWYICTLAII